MNDVKRIADFGLWIADLKNYLKIKIRNRKSEFRNREKSPLGSACLQAGI